MSAPPRHVTRSRARPGGADARPEGALAFRERKPPWLKVKAPGGPVYRNLKHLMRSQGLNTVCEEANCPNIGECWERGTATFMILGDVCTRRCGFCNVKSGVPGLVDRAEPLRVANAVRQMGLRHCVVTSVDRDDLPDLGAGAFVHTIRAIRERAPGCAVEVLTPDFRGQEMPLARVIDARPDVFNHNVETVPRLYPVARRGSEFLRSCRVLRNAHRMDPGVITKSGLMVGLGETMDELLATLELLREHDVQVVTVGQYLRPSPDHLPVARYWTPDEFAAVERAAYAMGFESPVRWCGAPTTRTSRSPCGAPRPAPCSARHRPVRAADPAATLARA
jgi:lipoic acid synthetase